jgi:hypothetical protein
MDILESNKLLDELYELTQKEQDEEGLTADEMFRYVEIVKILNDNNIDIHFRIEL